MSKIITYKALKLLRLIAYSSELRPTNSSSSRLNYNKSEIERLKTWVEFQQSFHGGFNKLVPHLLEVLITEYPEFRLTSEDQVFLMNSLANNSSKKGPISTNYLRQIMAQLSHVIEDYLVYTHLKEKEDFRSQLLIEAFATRKKSNWSKIRINKEIKQLEDQKNKSSKEYLALFHLYKKLFQDPTGGYRHNPKNNILHKISQNLNQFYFLEKAMLTLESKKRAKVIQDSKRVTTYDLETEEIGDRLKEILPEEKAQALPFQLYLYQLTNIQNKLVEWVPHNHVNIPEMEASPIMTLLKAKESPLNQSDKKILFIWILNEIMESVDLNYKEKLRVLFEWYNLGLEGNLLLNYGQISDRTYFNMVTLCNQLNEFKHVRSFIEQYTDCVENDIRPLAYKWANAHLQYHQKGTIDENIILNNDDRPYHLFTLHLKILEVKNRYDQILPTSKGFNFTMDYINASMRWIKDDKVASGVQKTKFRKFLKVTEKLMKLKVEVDEARKERLQRNITKEMKDAKNLHSQIWLTNKLREIVD